MNCAKWCPIYYAFFRSDGLRVYLVPAPWELILFDFSKTTADLSGSTTIQGDSNVVVVVYDRIRSVFGRNLRPRGFWEQEFNSTAYVLREVADSLGATVTGIHYMAQ